MHKIKFKNRLSTENEEYQFNLIVSGAQMKYELSFPQLLQKFFKTHE